MLKKTVNAAVPAPLMLPRAYLTAAGFAERQWTVKRHRPVVRGAKVEAAWLGWEGRHKACPYRRLRGMAKMWVWSAVGRGNGEEKVERS